MEVQSSNIKTVKYNRRWHYLTLTFVLRPLWEYTYLAVPPKIYTELIKSESKGQYFAYNIRDKFRFRVVKHRK